MIAVEYQRNIKGTWNHLAERDEKKPLWEGDDVRGAEEAYRKGRHAFIQTHQQPRLRPASPFLSFVWR